MIEPGRKYVQGNNKYRYGFNGKEKDNEIKGEGNQQDYGMRIYDPRLGKFLSVDPITSKYPELTPYQFASNRPIDGIDLDGLEFFSYKWYMGQSPLRILTREGAKTLINKPIALAFKQAFSTELPKKFIDRYASESGKPYKLNNKELEGLHVTHVGLHGGTKKSIKTANDFLSSIKPGESKELPKGFSIGDAAGEAGTLGRFTIKLKGAVEKDKEGNWTFKGQMQFYDVYDFKTKKPKKGQAEEGLERNASADKQTEFADNYLPGKGFKITSDWIPVEQNSKKDDFFDWFKGKSQEPTHNREVKKPDPPK